jgi:xanthine dehydrogenase iron-sulfur cluster and FAD-binding subunit A
MWAHYHCVNSIDAALRLLDEHRERAVVVAGATDVMPELFQGTRPHAPVVVDISRVLQPHDVTVDAEGIVHLGPLTTLADCATSPRLSHHAFPLVQAVLSVGSPSIRNRGTVVGNLVSAAAAADTIPPLLALGARLRIESRSSRRQLRLDEFLLSHRINRLRSDELVTDVAFPAMRDNQRGVFIKHALRESEAVAVVNVAVWIDQRCGIIDGARIAIGGASPRAILAPEAAAPLIGARLTPAAVERSAEVAATVVQPVDDIRASGTYRRKMIRVLVQRALEALADGGGRDACPTRPVRLGPSEASAGPRPLPESVDLHRGRPIVVTINGQVRSFACGHGGSLMRLLREQAGLTSVKNGCERGDCGACTVLLDGMAVKSCLVPAERAHLADVVTVDSLGRRDALAPLQRAFLDHGAVQCGYCTPGMLLVAKALWDERGGRPTFEDIIQAISGNLCRCTGYHKIIEAIADGGVAAEEGGASVGEGRRVSEAGDCRSRPRDATT